LRAISAGLGKGASLSSMGILRETGEGPSSRNRGREVESDSAIVLVVEEGVDGVAGAAGAGAAAVENLLVARNACVLCACWSISGLAAFLHNGERAGLHPAFATCCLDKGEKARASGFKNMWCLYLFEMNIH